MSPGDALRAFIEPLLPGWRVQFGRWTDGSKQDRYAVLRPVGGLPVALVRRPHFSLLLIGSANDDAQAPGDAAEALLAVMRAEGATSGALVFMQTGEPVFSTTNDGRPMAELSIETITN
jgi:hypothetical protein